MLEGLDHTSLYQLLRAAKGDIEHTRNSWTSRQVSAAFDLLQKRGLLARGRSTPKGRKQFYKLTEAGRALIPAVKEHFAARQAEIEEERKRLHAEEMVRAAAPDLLAACEAAAGSNVWQAYPEVLSTIQAAIKKATS